MPSSWRWANDEEYREHVSPHAISGNNHVRRYETSFCFAENCRILFDNVRDLEAANTRLAKVLEDPKGRLSDAQDIAEGMCQDGEEMLLFQRRLAITMGAYDFLHGKESIEKAMRDASKGVSRFELEQFRDDVAKMLQAFDIALSEDAKFLADDVRDLPKYLRADFLKARDLCSVGFEDVGLMLCGRGFEKVVRDILLQREVHIAVNNRIQPASKAQLHDLLNAMGRLKYEDDGKQVFSRQSVQQMQWVKEIRNDMIHDGEDDISADERTLATTLAQISARLWASHLANKARPLQEATIRKEW